MAEADLTSLGKTENEVSSAAALDEERGYEGWGFWRGGGGSPEAHLNSGWGGVEWCRAQVGCATMLMRIWELRARNGRREVETGTGLIRRLNARKISGR